MALAAGATPLGRGLDAFDWRAVAGFDWLPEGLALPTGWPTPLQIHLRFLTVPSSFSEAVSILSGLTEGAVGSPPMFRSWKSQPGIEGHSDGSWYQVVAQAPVQTLVISFMTWEGC